MALAATDGMREVPHDQRYAALAAAREGHMLIVERFEGQVIGTFIAPCEVFPAPDLKVAVRERGMLVTLITDASVHSDTKSGGWAAWGKSERGQCEGSGPIKSRFTSSATAELFAIVNGVHLLFARGIARPGDRILAQVDNIMTKHMVDAMRSRPRFADHAQHNEALTTLAELLGDNRATIETRHIKAHVGTDEPRHWVHDRCDRLARRAARQLRAQLIAEARGER